MNSTVLRGSHSRPAPISAASILVLGAFLLFAGNGCSSDTVVVVVERGAVLSDFKSIGDYLSDPTVQDLFITMPRYQGSNPPDISGEYSALGTVVDSIPLFFIGESSEFFFCFGKPVGQSLVTRIFDETIEDGGARCLVEGSGDNFTVYTGFRSVQPTTGGESCEIHIVVVLSGTREADGSLSELFIGQAVVAVLGDCSDVFVSDYEVALMSGTRDGDACISPPDVCNDVDLVIDNFLTSPIVVSVDYPNSLGPLPFTVFPNAFEDPPVKQVAPGFTMSFTSLQPSAFGNANGGELALGEIVGGTFPEDISESGMTVTYTIENTIGDDVYYAPLPANLTAEPIYAVVNSGIDYGVRPLPLDTGLGCVCPMDPDPNVFYDIGYYSYSVPGFITPAQTNVRFFKVSDNSEIAPAFTGPFALEAGSGVVSFDVVP